MEKRRILITGGAGYLGSVMTRKFLTQGHSVTALDSLLYNQQTPLCFAREEKYHFLYGDARDSRVLKEIVPQHDVLIPLAAIVGYPACDARPDDARTINHGAVAMLNLLRSPSQQLLYPTTNSGYGITTGEVHCTEESPLNPISLYGETKAAAEQELLEGDKDVIAFRLATVFGLSPRMRLDLLVNDFTYKAVRDRKLILYEKDFMRNFVHIEDIARVFEYSMEHFEEMKQKRLYNVGHPQANMSKEQLSLIIKKYVPDLIIEEGGGNDPDKRNYIVSNRRILEAGFEFLHPLEEGVQELVRAFSILNVPHITAAATNIGKKNGANL